MSGQLIGALILWLIIAIIAIAIVVLWSRSDDREQKRYDRKADRDGDAELEEYNRMLAERAASKPISRQ